MFFSLKLFLDKKIKSFNEKKGDEKILVVSSLSFQEEVYMNSLFNKISVIALLLALPSVQAMQDVVELLPYGNTNVGMPMGNNFPHAVEHVPYGNANVMPMGNNFPPAQPQVLQELLPEHRESYLDIVSGIGKDFLNFARRKPVQGVCAGVGTVTLVPLLLIEAYKHPKYAGCLSVAVGGGLACREKLLNDAIARQNQIRDAEVASLNQIRAARVARLEQFIGSISNLVGGVNADAQISPDSFRQLIQDVQDILSRTEICILTQHVACFNAMRFSEYSAVKSVEGQSIITIIQDVIRQV